MEEIQVPDVHFEIGPLLTIETVDIADLKEQDVNAQVMEPEEFERLVQNIVSTKRLESVPFCVQPEGKGQIQIASGHHRVRGARTAGMTRVIVMVDRAKLTRSNIVAKQLAHNALVGHSDRDILARLVALLETPDDILESGLPESMVPTPEDTGITLFTPHADYRWKTIAFVFLEHQAEHIEQLVRAIDSKCDPICVACQDQFEPFLRAVADMARERKILSAGMAVSVLTQLAISETAIARVQREEDEADVDSLPWVSIPRLFGSATTMPVAAALVVRQAVDKMRANGDISETNPWQALEYMAASYLGESSGDAEPEAAIETAGARDADGGWTGRTEVDGELVPTDTKTDAKPEVEPEVVTVQQVTGDGGEESAEIAAQVPTGTPAGVEVAGATESDDGGNLSTKKDPAVATRSWGSRFTERTATKKRDAT